MRFFWVEKILPRFFRLREIHKKPKNSYFLIFLPPTPTNGVYNRNFPYARIQLILYNNPPEFRSNRRQIFFSKKPWTPTFYRICTSKKRLNGHSSLIKHIWQWIVHRWIPLFNALLLSRKNFTSFFSFKRNSQKTKKLIFLDIFGSHANKWGLWPELSLCPNSTHPIQ
jgi:hypothetical protein